MANDKVISDIKKLEFKIERIKLSVKDIQKDFSNEYRDYSDKDSFEYKFLIARIKTTEKELDKVKKQIGLAN
jgi:DNA-binding transcriptional MerR regulator